MALLDAMNPNRQPHYRKPEPKGEPTTVFVSCDSHWYFLVGAIVNDYPAGTIFGPYATASDAMNGRDRAIIGAYDQAGLDAALKPAPQTEFTPLRLVA